MMTYDRRDKKAGSPSALFREMAETYLQGLGYSASDTRHWASDMAKALEADLTQRMSKTEELRHDMALVEEEEERRGDRYPRY